MIYASSVASGVNHIIQYSSKPEAELNNALFLTRAEPKLKTCCYFALMSYVTVLFTESNSLAIEAYSAYNQYNPYI